MPYLVRKVDVVSKYIANQKEHHRKMTFREEVESIMKRYGVVEYDSNEKDNPLSRLISLVF